MSVARERTLDEASLIGLLQSARATLVGLRMVHFHLSRLADPQSIDPAVVLDLLEAVAADTPGYARMFKLSNGDVVMMYRGLQWSEVDDACQSIAALALRRTRMIAQNPYTQDATLYSIFELLSNLKVVLERLEHAMEGPAPTYH